MSEIKKRLQTFYKDFQWDVIAEPQFYCFFPRPEVPLWHGFGMFRDVTGHYHQGGEVPAEQPAGDHLRCPAQTCTVIV